MKPKSLMRANVASEAIKPMFGPSGVSPGRYGRSATDARRGLRKPARSRRQAPRSEGRQTTLVRQLRQRIDLIHELAQLAATKEVADHRAAPSIDELWASSVRPGLIEQRHAFLDQTLGTRQTNTALVGQQFAHRADAAAAQVIDVVQRTFALFKRSRYFVALTKSSLVRMRSRSCSRA